jgi:hypothetical protein
MKYYDSIHNLPIFYFDIINKTHDYSHLVVKGQKKGNVNLEKVWIRIYDEYLDHFGLDETYENWMLFRKEAIRLYTQAYLEDQHHLIPLAQAKELEAKEMMSEIDGEDLNVTLARLSRVYGYRMDPMSITVVEYFSLIKDAESYGKKNKT